MQPKGCHARFPFVSVLRDSFEDPRLRLLVCGYTRISPNQWNISGVSLPFWRFYWNASPGASIRCEGVTVDLGPLVAVLIPPNTLFSTVNNKRSAHLYIHFQMLAMERALAPQVVRLPMKSPLTGVREALCELLLAPEPVARRVSLVGRSLVELAVSMADIEEGNPLDIRIAKVIAYMDEHLQPSTTNADLAREAGMGVSALNHLFKEQIGQSLQTFLRFKRIEKAGLRLQFSDASIDQIAEETGFCDRYHFSKVFRALQGLSPAAFRQAHANPFVTQKEKV